MQLHPLTHNVWLNFFSLMIYDLKNLPGKTKQTYVPWMNTLLELYELPEKWNLVFVYNLYNMQETNAQYAYLSCLLFLLHLAI